MPDTGWKTFKIPENEENLESGLSRVFDAYPLFERIRITFDPISIVYLSRVCKRFYRLFRRIFTFDSRSWDDGIRIFDGYEIEDGKTYVRWHIRSAYSNSDPSFREKLEYQTQFWGTYVLSKAHADTDVVDLWILNLSKTRRENSIPYCTICFFPPYCSNRHGLTAFKSLIHAETSPS